MIKIDGQINKIVSQLFRFGIVGGTAFLIDYGILYCLTEFGAINYLISGMISFTVSVIYNYILSRIWVFEAKKNNNKAMEFLIFVILSIIGLGINQLIMYVGVEKIGIYYMVTKIIATVIVMIYNFITRKMFME